MEALMAKGGRRVGFHRSSPFQGAPDLRLLTGNNGVTTVPCWPQGPSRYLTGLATLSCAPQGPCPVHPAHSQLVPSGAQRGMPGQTRSISEETMQYPEGTSRGDACQRGQHPQTDRGSFGAGGTGSSQGQGQPSQSSDLWPGLHPLTTPGGPGTRVGCQASGQTGRGLGESKVTGTRGSVGREPGTYDDHASQ